MNFSSKLIEDAVKAFSSLPGIGQKTALRMVLHLLKEDKETVEQFGEAIVRMRQEIKFCNTCGNISDGPECSVCSNPARDHSQVCVVENIRDVLAIENTGVYKGVYHVLGGVISPVDGIGPDELNMDSLFHRIENGEANELIMALNPTMEGDTTIFYISRKLKDKKVKITSISRGVSFGGELEFTDELTLARSISSRLPFENYLTDQ